MYGAISSLEEWWDKNVINQSIAGKLPEMAELDSDIKIKQM